MGSALVVYYSFLVQIASPDERDRVSSVGWSFGYLGGFILLALNLVVVEGHSAFGLSTSQAVRVSLVEVPAAEQARAHARALGGGLGSGGD